MRTIGRGDHVFVGSACATPRVLLSALESLPSPPAGVQLVHFLTDGAVPEVDGQAQSAFRHRTFYLGRDMLRLSASDHVDYVPMSLAEVPRLLELAQLDASARETSRADVPITPVFGPGTWRHWHLREQFFEAGRRAGEAALGRLAMFAHPSRY